MNQRSNSRCLLAENLCAPRSRAVRACFSLLVVTVASKPPAVRVAPRAVPAPKLLVDLRLTSTPRHTS